MPEVAAEHIELSAGAVEELFRLYVRQWALAVGRVNFAKTIGVSTSRLGRALAGATPAYDLAYRIHETCRVHWPAIFTGASATIGTVKSVARAEQERDISLDEGSVSDAEVRARARLRDVVEKFGFMECARGAGIAPASLHYYLTSTRLSLALMWRLHLLTGAPYSEIAGGEMEWQEKHLRETLGREQESQGRFEDLSEAIVRLVERYVYNDMSEAATPYVRYMERLLKRKLTLPQKVRVRRILTLYHDDMGETKAASSLVRRNWQDLRRRKVDFTILLSHLTVTGHAGLLDHAQEVAARITQHTDDPRIISQVHRVQAEIALENMQIYEAQSLARKAVHVTMNAASVHRSFILAQLENVLAICAWAFGDYNEALSRIGRLQSSKVTPLHIRRIVTELEINIRVWLRDVPGAFRALKSFGSCSVSVLNTEAFSRRMDIYRLRCLLLKKGAGTELSAAEGRKLEALGRQFSVGSEGSGDAESRLVEAVCAFLAHGEKRLLKNLIKGLVSGRRLRGGMPLLALPDFLDAVAEAGLWESGLECWKSRAIERGVLNFNMMRPEK